MAKKKTSKPIAKKKDVKIVNKVVNKSIKDKQANKQLKAKIKEDLKTKKATKKADLEKESAELEQKLKLEREKLEKKRLGAILSSAVARQYLIDLAGENTLAIIKNFATSTSDEELSKNLKLKISDVRATLNKLHSQGLVNYLRQKDSETGWFSYSWTLNSQKIEEWLNTKLKEKRATLDLNGENYFCSSCGLESLVSFEHASNCGFKCNKCEKDLEFLEEMTRLEELNGIKL
ncbi:MAG: hypothetical protein AABX38_00835 [Candidatus Micrarchaeota archaeon]